MTPAAARETRRSRASPPSPFWIMSGVITSATPIAAAACTERHPGDRAEPEPLVGRVVQRPPVARRVCLRCAERPSDHRRRRLVHRQPAGDVGGEADAQQLVLADRPGDMGAELHPVRPVPEQGFLPDLQVPQRERGDQPPPDGAVLRPDGRGAGRRAVAGALGRQVPRALAPARVLVVLLLQHKLVAGPAQHVPAGELVGDRQACRPWPGRRLPGRRRSRSWCPRRRSSQRRRPRAAAAGSAGSRGRGRRRRGTSA